MTMVTFTTVVAYLNGRVVEHEFKTLAEAKDMKTAACGDGRVSHVLVERHDIRGTRWVA